MKHQAKIVFLFSLSVLFIACAAYAVLSRPNAGALVGGDRDSHDCIGSAGYSWCEQRKACIRPWEQYCTATAPKQASFYCDGSKSIAAVFYLGDDKFVDLVLSDGKAISVPRAMSASGARYANGDESFVFWNKGDTAFITENNAETYSNCSLRVWNLANKDADLAVRSFLLSVKELAWKTSEKGKNLCIFQDLAPEKELFPHYLWVRCGEFAMENGEMKELSGTSVPLKIDYPNELSFFDQKKFTVAIPRDGSLYDKDVKTIFPAELAERLHFDSQPLNRKIEEEARKFFSL